ncbi:T9SS type A sorting domain-containing protein [uncultured Pontibacter sp.]|uniref:T9SS type A sorting domain-containing protein n=1 Tax=uncultured Pontibacter sp. TaxID=453356 RepID=UPI002603A789|nr:T9SS type A sorting domain-containing protein [uncultured Pontibacter sp.]
MKSCLYLIALVATFCIGGCSQADPEPDFSGIQDIPYTVQQFSGTTGGTTHVSIYPNPFFSHLTIEVHNPDNTPATIYVSDEKGKYSKKFEVHEGGGTSLFLDFSRMPKGVYICEVQQPGKVDRYRLVRAQ